MMEQEDRERLIRIDERTATLVETLGKHVTQDREDFKEVHSRVNRLAAKQNWIIGIFSSLGVGMSVIGLWLKSNFTGGA